MFDATIWAAIALVIFLGIVFKAGVHKTIGASLDNRSDKIKDELDEARKLREEAQELLAEYQRKRKEAELEAEEILDAAKREAELIAEDANQKTQEHVVRRTAMAEQKIASAEAQAISDVRSAAVDLAIAAAEKIIAGKVKGATADKLVKSSIAEVKARLN